MAKRMKFSVVGLPHYTVWHLYEPSVDDLRHMEEMERERTQREKEEKERQERVKKVKDEFHEPNAQWEKDKTELQSIAKKEEETAKQKIAGEASGPSIPSDPKAQAVPNSPANAQPQAPSEPNKVAPATPPKAGSKNI